MTTRTHSLRRTVIILAVVTSTATGCDLLPPDGPAAPAEPIPDTSATVVVVGRHANAADPVLVGEARSILRATVDGQGSLAFVVSDGTPVVEPGSRVFARNCGNDIACAAERDAYLDDSVRTAGGLTAIETENDLLGALVEAVRALPTASSLKTIVVADSGLSTAGTLRFQDPGVLAADPAEVAEFLARSAALPALDGVTVFFTGLGDTAAPQARPDAAVRANLRAVWSAVATRAGAAQVRFVDTPFPDPPRPGLPAVTVVPLPGPVAYAPGTREVVLPDTAVGFRPDTAEPRDVAAARRELEPLARRLITEGRSATLVGTTSSAGGTQGSRALSLQRAEAVKALLVGLGVPPARLATEGAGYIADPPDNENGVLLPGPAAVNRRVIVRLSTTP